LSDYLGVEHVSLVANATIGLITALQTLRITGEVITTPYSFVATTHALAWNNIQPVFVDIDPLTMNLDPDRIEAASEVSISETSFTLPYLVFDRRGPNLLA
jgi:dTDP-4-amino-4,6-dideoxygalactose transaminase